MDRRRLPPLSDLAIAPDRPPHRAVCFTWCAFMLSLSSYRPLSRSLSTAVCEILAPQSPCFSKLITIALDPTDVDAILSKHFAPFALKKRGARDRAGGGVHAFERSIKYFDGANKYQSSCVCVCIGHRVCVLRDELRERHAVESEYYPPVTPSQSAFAAVDLSRLLYAPRSMRSDSEACASNRDS